MGAFGIPRDPLRRRLPGYAVASRSTPPRPPRRRSAHLRPARSLLRAARPSHRRRKLRMRTYVHRTLCLGVAAGALILVASKAEAKTRSNSQVKLPNNLSLADLDGDGNAD